MPFIFQRLVNVLSALASLRIAVWVLLLFMVVIFFGTLYQVNHGLHAAQDQFYYSWLTPAISQWYTPESPDSVSRSISWMIIPLPGGLTILWVLFINLFLSMVMKFRYGWGQFGSILTHAGLLFLLAGGWVTHITAEEGYLTLQEGEASNVATSYTDWEVALWEGEQIERDVFAYSVENCKPGDQLVFEQVRLYLEVESYYQNADAFIDPDVNNAVNVFNVAGITRLEAIPPDKNPERNLPGILFTAWIGDGAPEKLLLYAGDPSPVMLVVDEKPWFLELRRKRIPLPVKVKLQDFRAEFKPNSTIPARFSSQITVEGHGMERQVIVEMNRPFRHAGFTFFQSSYGEADDGSEMSTFAVVHNRWMLAPYIATGITVIGLIIHFATEMLRPRRGLKGDSR